MTLTKVMVIDEGMLVHKDACKDGFNWFMKNIKELPIENLKLVEGDYKAYIRWLKRRFIGVEYYKDENGRVVKEVKEDEEITFAYNNDGNLIKAVSVLPSGEDSWEKIYDSKGRILREYHFLTAIETTYKYDKKGRVIEVEKGDWKKVTSYPDKYTKEVKVYNRGEISQTETLTYNDEGLLIKRQTPHYWKTISYDKNGNIADTIDGAGTKSSRTYDDEGNMLSLKCSNGWEEKITYDKNGNATSSEDNCGGSWTRKYIKTKGVFIQKLNGKIELVVPLI